MSFQGNLQHSLQVRLYKKLPNLLRRAGGQSLPFLQPQLPNSQPQQQDLNLNLLLSPAGA